MSVPVTKFLRARRDRAVGTILGYAESQVKPQLTEAQWTSLREVVLSATNSYHDTVLDLVKADEGSVRNDHLVEVLERVDHELRAGRRRRAVSGV